MKIDYFRIYIGNEMWHIERRYPDGYPDSWLASSDDYDLEDERLFHGKNIGEAITQVLEWYEDNA